MESYSLMQKEAEAPHDSMEPNQAGQRAGTRQSRDRTGMGRAVQGRSKRQCLLVLKRCLSFSMTIYHMFIDNEQQMQKPMLTCIRNTSIQQ